jgi:phage repressor protein C with HTH and peptisase S24 domain
MLERLELFKKNLLSLNIDIATVKGLSSAAMYSYRTKGNVPKGDSLEEWGTRFGLSLNWLLWGEGGMLALDGPPPHTPSGSAPTAPVPILGLADCGMEGIEQVVHWATTASPIHLGPRAVAVLASGESMVPAGIVSGNLCFCDPDQTPLSGEAVFLRQRDNKGALKLFLGKGEREGFTTFRGWLPAETPGAAQKDFTMQVDNTLIDCIAPIIAVRRRL